RGDCRLAGVGPTTAVPDGRRPVRGQPGHAATVKSGLVPGRRAVGRAAAGRGRVADVTGCVTGVADGWSAAADHAADGTDRWPAVADRVAGVVDRWSAGADR